MQRRTPGQSRKRPYKQGKQTGKDRPSPTSRSSAAKMAPSRHSTRGEQGETSTRPAQRTRGSPEEVDRDPFSSQTSGEAEGDIGGDLVLSQPSPASLIRLPDEGRSPCSSMDRNMADMAESLFSQASPAHEEAPQHPAPYAGDAVLLARFSAMLQQELSKACSIITNDIKQDIQSFGTRIDTIETKIDETLPKVNQHSKCISELYDRLEEAYSKIEDLENRSRRYNVRIRGLPENHSDLEEAVQSLMRDLIPGIKSHHLEIDRVHRALTAPRQDGLPRDIIVKPHYYSIKEKLMAAARNRPDIQLLGSSIQLYADLAPSTVQKRRNLKPLLQQLMKHQIKYRWSFPFRLSFTYRGKNHFFSTYQEGEELLLQLGIITTEPQTSSSQGQGQSNRPVSPIWSTQRSRAAKKKQPAT